jgi:thiol-disulfide isomerase/thioredoxin
MMRRRTTNVKTIVSKEEYESAVAMPHGCIVMANARWCELCKGLGNEIALLSVAYADVPIYVVEMDDNFELVSKTMKVSAYPTFQHYKAGELKKEIVGASLDDVTRMVKDFHFTA